MNDDSDTIRRALQAEARSAPPSRIDWQYVSNRTRRALRRRRQFVASALGVMVIGAGVAGLMLTSGDEPDSDSVAVQETTIPPVTDSTLTVVDTPAARPSTVVGITRDGRLLAIDVATGSVLRELAFEGDPAGEVDGISSFIDHATVDLSRSRVVYSVCCEPAVGQIKVVPLDGGPVEFIADGSGPDMNADNGLMATVSGSGVQLRTPMGTYVRSIEAPPDIAPSLRRVSWTKDGAHLIVESGGPDGASSRLFVVDQTATSFADATELRPPEGHAWSSAAPFAEDRLAVLDAHDSVTDVLIVDRQGQPVSTVDLGGRTPVALSVDSSRTWILVTLYGGGLLAIDDSLTVQEIAYNEVLVTADW